MAAFRYSLNASTIRTTPVLQKIKAAAHASFDGIELWFDDLDAWTAAGKPLSELRKILDDLGLTVPSLIHLKN